jgi:exopolyphosphatase/guanosine-5'-triphosphate,3'-diphosphate pyrophosphatase
LRIAHNYALETDAAQALANWAMSTEGAQALLAWPGVSARRADTLPYSGLMLAMLIERLAPARIIIAAGGLRDGVLYASLSDVQKQRSALFDACRAFAMGSQEAAGFGEPLFSFLNGFAQSLPVVFGADNENRLRRAACLLGGIGKGLHPGHKARMVFRSVLYAPLPSLTHKERAYLALMLFGSYTSKETTPNADAIAYLLSPREQACARVYGEAMRLATLAAGRSAPVLAKFTLRGGAAIALDIAPSHELLFTDKISERLEGLRYRLSHLHTLED